MDYTKQLADSFQSKYDFIPTSICFMFARFVIRKLMTIHEAHEWLGLTNDIKACKWASEAL